MIVETYWFFNKQPVYKQLDLRTKKFKQVVELYQLGKDKNRKSTESSYFNTESKKIW